MVKFEELSVPVPWGFISGKSWGNREKFPVLLVHGLLDNAGAFNSLIPMLPRNFFYVSIDLPGHGFSSHFPAGIPLDFLNYVLAIKYVLQAFKWRSFFYIGHSFGAQLGMIYSIIHPGGIKKLIMLDAVMPEGIVNKNIISIIRKVHEICSDSGDNVEAKLYSKDEIIYALKNKRMFCLTTTAAENIFERSVTQIVKDGATLYQLNRDLRISRARIKLMLTEEQIFYIASQLNVETLLILTHASLESVSILKYRANLVRKLGEYLEMVKFEIVKGNHDVHNNNPERVAPLIAAFVNLSKL